MKKVQTDNSFLSEKIFLRKNNLPKKDSIKVLSAYGGDCIIWGIISDDIPNISLVSIDIKKDKKNCLIGDNKKFLLSMDLSAFDVIDLDAYGIPIDQLRILFDKNYHGIVFVTFIQSGIGCLNKSMLIDLGYTEKMIKKIPTIFYRNGFDKFKNWLSMYCVKYIKCYNFGRKHYLCFTI